MKKTKLNGGDFFMFKELSLGEIPRYHNCIASHSFDIEGTRNGRRSSVATCRFRGHTAFGTPAVVAECSGRLLG